MYETILARSFSRHEQKKLGFGAFVCCLLIALSFCTVFRSYLGPLPNLKLRLSVGVHHKLLKDTSSSNENEITSPQIDKDEEIVTEKVVLLCTKEERTDFCGIEGDVRVHGNTSSVYSVTGQLSILAENTSWSVRPYARKEDPAAMSGVREWTVKPVDGSHEIPQCTKNHSIPAVLFSIAGYLGNPFHDFADVLIPLFSTSRKFNGEVQFLITDKQPWWISKFQVVLNALSKYELIDIDTDNEVHCFPAVTVGLKRYHIELSMDPSYNYSIKDFRDFLRNVFSLKRAKAIKISDDQRKKPRLLIISRNRTRSFINTGQIGKLAESLGYEVVIAEAENVSSFAEIVNSCDVMMGVHGAGLTNMLFLPENAILIQVLPYGGFEWLATGYGSDPSKDMDLKYLEYKIRMEESTLIQQYPLDHEVLRDPSSIQKQGWKAFGSVYMNKQNVKLDINRFRPTLMKALELLH
ncbi:protein O-linked-mannose beta-1,4-N-acetylglucosaminyltransferase 2-like [Quillaja saponaria]|uniref:Protein O-linked-mannose beta-1,4-N-acetylglucosaminyltransferase 2-like n=1 Tax=Quillaja saponaria TaxID=32244 RepID=A0AAD7Q5D3_QUISA|nr:protein O-linked-mannose beta-1,4-N-acetylglucosaminyltransferase 2-like [Quillaja saponaria]